MKDEMMFKWGYPLLTIASVLLVLFLVFVRTSKPDPDRARFMLECTHDWMLTPEQCRDILNGEDPVVPPPEAGC